MKAKDLIKLLEKNPDNEVLLMNTSIISDGDDQEACPCFNIQSSESGKGYTVLEYNDPIYIDPIFNCDELQNNSLCEKDIHIIHNGIEEKIPIFVFTAKDELSVFAIEAYEKECKRLKLSKVHIEDIRKRVDQFEK